MASQVITNFDAPDERIQRSYSEAKESYKDFNFEDLDIIFTIVLRDKSLFPAINLQNHPNIGSFVAKWVKGYVDAKTTLPSQRISNPKSSCSDPAIKAIVQASKDLSDEKAEIGEKIHNLFMSAENIQGSLLEEFIAGKVRIHGWVWCCGNVMRSIDFCSLDGTKLLQIKNKSNTENSSSSAIRTGTTIKKWYRLGTRVVGGTKLPKYMWADLNDIINSHKINPQLSCAINEESYIEFLRQVTSSNTRLITEK